MSGPWRDISSAPKQHHQHDFYRIAILAKIWISSKDEFEFKRFTDCVWHEKFENTPAHWQGVENGWRAVAWMPIPETPKQWP